MPTVTDLVVKRSSLNLRHHLCLNSSGGNAKAAIDDPAGQETRTDSRPSGLLKQKAADVQSTEPPGSTSSEDLFEQLSRPRHRPPGDHGSRLASGEAAAKPSSTVTELSTPNSHAKLRPYVAG